MIKLVRVDFRTVHAQVMYNWVRILNITKIILIDDELSHDDFLQMIYKSSAPAETTLEFASAEEGAKNLKEGVYDDKDDSTIILFKLIDQMYKVYKAGYKFDKIQIGGAPAGPGRKNITNGVSITAEEHDQLAEVKEAGVNVYFQTVPGLPEYSYEEVMKNY